MCRGLNENVLHRLRYLQQALTRGTEKAECSLLLETSSEKHFQKTAQLTIKRLRAEAGEMAQGRVLFVLLGIRVRFLATRRKLVLETIVCLILSV